VSIEDIAKRKSQIRREACRLLILQALADDANFTIYHMVMIQLLADYDHAAADVRQDLIWLEEHGLIVISSKNDAPSSTITRLGEDVAFGRSSISGVSRPRPGM